MARVKNFDQLTGTIGNLSFYTRKGSSEVFARRKGGASKEKIKTDPAFANLRKANKEFGGCSKMSKQIRLAFYGLEHVADYNLAPALSKLANELLKTDTVHPKGDREIVLSKYRYVLTGFDFSRTTRFNSLLRVPIGFNIEREKQTAIVQIPAFTCSFGLNSKAIYSYFRLTAALGIVTDMHLNPANKTYEPVHDKLGQGYQTRSTAWFSTQGSVSEQELTLSLLSESVTQSDTLTIPASENVTQSDALTTINFTHADTLVLSLILEFGTPDVFGNIMPVRGVGGGMVLGVG